MLDIRLIREHQKAIETKLQTKDPKVSLSSIIELDSKHRSLLTLVEELKAKRNKVSKEIGLKKRKQEDASSQVEEMSTVSDQITQMDHEITSIEYELKDKLSYLPNIPFDGIKVSLDPADNVELSSYGKKREFDFPFKNHLELNEKLDLFDFKRGSKISGSGFPIYKNLGARLEFALIQYMLETHINNGFMQWMVPHLTKPETMYGSGQLPKFDDQQFKIKDEHYDLYMIPTSETVLNGLHMDEILKEEELPLKYVSYTPCFRREAGAAGSQERGLIRVHQFNKVEMFCLTTPEQSDKIFDMMMASAESILQGLDLHYRNMLLVTGDMSFQAAKTVDIEVFLPGQDRYYEVSSVSNCTDFQARRSKIRYKNKDGKNTFLHTLNGSGLATSRLMVALLENGQQKDGSVLVPKPLQKYIGVDVINPLT